MRYEAFPQQTYFLNLQYITWDDLWCLNLEETAITEDDCLQCEGLLQFVDDRPGLEFLDESDSSVKQEECADDTEVDPVLETSGKDCSCLLSKLANLILTCDAKRAA